MSQEDVELESFLPRYSTNPKYENTPNATVEQSNEFPTLRRTRVQFVTDLTESGGMTTKDAVYIFNKDATIRQAVDIAIAHYPVPNNAPLFTETAVFFQPDGLVMKRVHIPDLDVNVHGMFGPDDTMVITDDPHIFERSLQISQKGFLRVLMGLVFFFIMFFGALIIMS